MRAQRKGIKLACHVSSNVPDTLRGDPARLRQIVINLVGNAIKFTSEGEVTVRADLAKDKGGEVELHFVVTDTGVGIPKGKQKAIFEAFTQADSSTTRKYGGTGLGLAISSQLIQIMGGRIWVESEEGRGTAFHFIMNFPLQEAPTEIQAIADKS
jgi:two-component system, sensor histidine kinase and response regulator